MSKILGLDVGDRKIGLAIGDPATRMAFVRPALLIDRWDQLWMPLKELVETENVTACVVGLPRNANGTEGPQAVRVREFAAELEHQLGLPVSFRDEFGTSQAVQREHLGQKLSRGQEDSLAAQLVVESYLQETTQ